MIQFLVALERHRKCDSVFSRTRERQKMNDLEVLAALERDRK